MVGCDEGAAIQRRDDDAADALGREILDDLHLLLAVVLAERTLPDDLHVDALGLELLLGLHGAGMDGLPELVGSALGNDRDAEGLGGAAEGGDQRQKQGGTQDGLHGVG